MAVLGTLTLNEIVIYEVDADPSVEGLAAPSGSLAIHTDGSLLYSKKDDNDDFNWTLISYSDFEKSLKQSISEKNQPNGYAGLDSSGKIPQNILPLIYETSEVIDGGNPSSIYLTEEIDGGGV